jgi:ABC-type multidrug transport system ATPase subunit
MSANQSSISTENLGYSIGARSILRDVSLEVPAGTFSVVVGENGAGKTTLLKLLMGVARPTSGRILVNGKEPHADPYASRSKIAYLAEKMSPPAEWSVGDFLSFNSFFYAGYSRDFEQSLLERFRISRDMRIGLLSAGETRRAQVVAELSFLPEIIVIDEITALLDIVGRADLMDALKDLKTRVNATIVMATNIIDDIDTYATDVILLHRGTLARHGSKDEFMKAAGGTSLTQTIATLIREAEGRATS